MDQKPETDVISPWHAGERILQRNAGVEERMEGVGRRVLRDHLTAQHQEFYPLLAFVVLGSVDTEGRPWATLRCNRPGFLHALDEHRLRIDIKRDRSDPAEQGMKDGDAIAALGIDLATRRRNRLNGIVSRSADTYFDIAVGQSYGNCPQYIQLRQFSFIRDPSQPSEFSAETSCELDSYARDVVANADTFFVASYTDREDGRRQVDVSHRGGKPGFVRVDENGSMTIPDFAGNLFFNTLGNILTNGKAGLTFPDFETGNLLQMTGDAEVVLESPEIGAFQGAERIWRFYPKVITSRRDALPLRSRFIEGGWSPNTLMTGSWSQAEGRLRAAGLVNTWRPFVVTKIADESESVRSFHLRPEDGAGTIAHLAGQHINVRVSNGPGDLPSIRTYTISSAPSDGLYRISVKRAGRVSRSLHDRLKVGDVLEIQGPYGDFLIDAAQTRPAVLLAGGIGITPLISMLRNVVYEACASVMCELFGYSMPSAPMLNGPLRARYVRL
jgi:predicted pyridoxine 5'-phosphate oxidase superfamily flavin-nucleotide-binding protein